MLGREPPASVRQPGQEEGTREGERQAVNAHTYLPEAINKKWAWLPSPQARKNSGCGFVFFHSPAGIRPTKKQKGNSRGEERMGSKWSKMQVGLAGG